MYSAFSGEFATKCFIYLRCETSKGTHTHCILDGCARMQCALHLLLINFNNMSEGSMLEKQTSRFEVYVGVQLYHI